MTSTPDYFNPWADPDPWWNHSPTLLPADERTDGVCRRLKANGKPCRMRISYRALGTCAWHLTAEEKALREAAEAAQEQARLDALDTPPACWSWDVPPDVDRTTPELALHEWHAGRCAICGIADALVEDHDHETGMTRGWLCRSCNTRDGLPAYRWGSRHIYAYYRRRPPAAILGVSFRYISPLWGPDSGTGPPPVITWENNPMRGVF